MNYFNNRFKRRNKLITLFIGAFATTSYIYFKDHEINSIIPLIHKNQSQYKSITKRECPPLQKSIRNLVLNDINKWSISVLDKDKNLIADINSNTPRVPASNQKLITTAYALDKLGPKYRLKTKLTLSPKGIYSIYGEGDPDLSFYDIETIADNIVKSHQRRYKLSKIAQINIYEESYKNWWPATWIKEDKLKTYGSPITRLSVFSNSTNEFLHHPISSFKQYLSKSLDQRGIPHKINIINHDQLIKNNLTHKTLWSKYSAPISALLSLANSESHNFTAEVLMRTASNNWNNLMALNDVSSWLAKRQISQKRFKLADASGLSRSNRVTSLGLVELLWVMNNHKNSNLYLSSMAILGLRGTLTDFKSENNIIGKFHGKTGTLEGVRSVSGIIKTQDGPIYISIIANRIDVVDETISLIISEANNTSLCS